MEKVEKVLVFGATGNIGGSVTKELTQRGWDVRAVTRNPQSEKARELAALGAEVVQADMEDRASLESAFAGMDRVFSVQNWMICGVEGEIRQAKMVADVARDAQVSHLVYGSAGVGISGTGIPHFESKVEVERYMRDLGLPVTAIRPSPFMELMTDKAFFPPVATWGTMPKVIGWDRPLPWIAVQDIGVAIANVFEDPETWIGRDINLIGDVRSLGDCREIYRSVNGKEPFRVPLPVALTQKLAGEELVQMWRWIKEWSDNNGLQQLSDDLATSREVCPDPHTVNSWLRTCSN